MIISLIASTIFCVMRQVMKPVHNSKMTIEVWESVNRVWKNVIEGNYSLVGDWDGLSWNPNWPSIIVRITRVLLSIVVALSITMILYNWLSYIIQTWQWKEGKSLVKNVVYIVIWILISLFSITIITLLQSVSTTLKNETIDDRNNEIDERLVDGDRRWIPWRRIFNH